MNKMSIVLSCILLFCCSTVLADDGPPEPGKKPSTVVNTPIEVNARIVILLRGGYKYTTHENGQPLLQLLVKHLTDKNLPPYVAVPIVDSVGNALGEVVILKSEVISISRRVIKEEVETGDEKLLEKLLEDGIKQPR